MVREKVVAKMRELGFTANEAKAYVTLLKNSPSTRYELSKSSGIPRSAIYDVISRLENIGAVSAIYSEPERYIPLPPDELFNLLEKRFESSIEDLRSELKNIETTIEPGNLWNILGYKNMLIKAKELINSAEKSIYINTWNREYLQLKEELLAAEKRGVAIIVFSFTQIDKDLRNVLSYHIPEEKLESIWVHKLILIRDREELLMGEADDKVKKHIAWTKNSAIVSTALDALVLDITLFGSRLNEDIENILSDESSGYENALERMLIENNPNISLLEFSNHANETH